MASVVHCPLNPQVRLFVPMPMASKLAYSTVQYSTAPPRKAGGVSTRFAPEMEDGRGDAGWDD